MHLSLFPTFKACYITLPLDAPWYISSMMKMPILILYDKYVKRNKAIQNQCHTIMSQSKKHNFDQNKENCTETISSLESSARITFYRQQNLCNFYTPLFTKFMKRTKQYVHSQQKKSEYHTLVIFVNK